MLKQIQKAIEMWKGNHTHGQILEATGLSYELELACTEIAKKYNLTADDIAAKADQLRDGMKWAEVEAIYSKAK